VQARTTDAGAKARRALQARTPQPVPKPSIPRRVGGTLVRGAVGTGIGLGVGAAIEKLPTDRQTKDRLQTATGVGAAALTPVTSTLLSIGGSTRRGETTKPSASDTATAYTSDPNKVSVRSAKPAYDPRNPYDITKWRLSNDPGVTTKMTKTELDKLTKPKFPDLRGSVVPGSVVPKGFVSTDPELAAQTERERQLSTGTQPKTETQTQTQAPSTTKTKVDTKDPKDPKTPPVKTLPIPVIPPVAKKPPTVTGPGNKTGRKVPGPGLPRIGLPGYRGKIGRRSNPQ
jgi:hypothetical protein